MTAFQVFLYGYLPNTIFCPFHIHGFPFPQIGTVGIQTVQNLNFCLFRSKESEGGLLRGIGYFPEVKVLSLNLSCCHSQ